MKFLFRQIDIAPLVFIRIAFGILAFSDVMGMWTYKHLYKDALSHEKFHFKYWGFQWVEPLPEPFMSIFFIALMASALMIALGWHYKKSCGFFFIGFTYTFLLEKGYYLNHAYLFCMLSFLMMLLPANRSFAVDVFRRPALKLTTIPYWPLFLLKMNMAIVYFFGGIAKINADWLQAQPLKIWLGYKDDMPILGPLWAHEFTPWFMSYGGLVFDLTIVFFLLFKRTRLIALGFVIFFHVTNLILFKIGIFPYLSTCLTLLFFAPEFPRNVMDFLNRKFNWYRRLVAFYNNLALKNGVRDFGNWITYTSQQQSWIKIAFLLFFTYHTYMPLRHHLIPTNVAWTEEAHRFSWRMLLRHKTGKGAFYVEDQETCKRTKIRTLDYLTKRQKRKMKTHPDLILQFAYHLRDEFNKEGKNVAVYANLQVALNGRPYCQYTNKEVDLAKEEWPFFGTFSWILPEEHKEKKKLKK